MTGKAIEKRHCRVSVFVNMITTQNTSGYTYEIMKVSSDWEYVTTERRSAYMLLEMRTTCVSYM